MTWKLPTVDDTAVWDTWLSAYHMPSLAVADRLGLFETLDAKPATAEELAAQTTIPLEPLKALLPMMSALGFLVPRRGRYQLTNAARLYLLHDSPTYWGNAFAVTRDAIFTDRLLQKFAVDTGTKHAPRPAESWESGQVSDELALNVARTMHSHSVPAALGVARSEAFADVKRLLDVGGGSGCFSIALAQQWSDLRCAIMELPAMCKRALQYVSDGYVSDRIDMVSVDMFRADWPTGYDAIFLSNIFHDWSPETNAALSASAFKALPSGGRIFLHEMLINDEGSGPLPAAAFSMIMVASTRGRQYSFVELAGFLEGAGFTDARAVDSYGYYSLVSARKP